MNLNGNKSLFSVIGILLFALTLQTQAANGHRGAVYPGQASEVLSQLSMLKQAIETKSLGSV